MGLVIRKIGFENARQTVIKMLEAKRNELERMLSYLAENLCSHVRENGAYTDRTGNLRSSCGARVYYKGEMVYEGGFEQVGGPVGDGSHGAAAALTALDAYQADISTEGFTIVVVAGENYARYVESKGYNVLHLTETEMIKQLSQIKQDILGK